MPRSPRRDHPDSFQHVMNRGSAHLPIFADDLDRLIFLELLAEACARHAVAVHAFCLMDNHFHLLLENVAGSIGKAMQHLTSRFTRRHNLRAGRDGPLFRGRYHAVAVSSDVHVLLVSRYIHLNPVAARLAFAPEQWRWSSAAAYIGQAEQPGWLATQTILSMFDTSGGPAAYAAFVAAGVDAPTAEFFAREVPAPVFDPYWRRGEASRAGVSDTIGA